MEDFTKLIGLTVKGKPKEDEKETVTGEVLAVYKRNAGGWWLILFGGWSSALVLVVKDTTNIISEIMAEGAEIIENQGV